MIIDRLARRYGWTIEQIENTSTDYLNALIGAANDSDDLEFQKECALRGIKYKKKQTLQKVESQELTDAVERIISGNKRS